MNKFLLSLLPRLCYENKKDCPAFREVDWIEETGICILGRCANMIQADLNFDIFDNESMLKAVFTEAEFFRWKYLHHLEPSIKITRRKRGDENNENI